MQLKIQDKLHMMLMAKISKLKKTIEIEKE